MDANIVVMGMESVGKSGKKTNKHIFSGDERLHLRLFSTQWTKVCVFLALTVRLLTRRFIGEYGDIGKCPLFILFIYC